jgi:hypothetical protein
MGHPDRFDAMMNEVGGFQLWDVRARPQDIPRMPGSVTKLRDGDFARKWPPWDVIACTVEPMIARHSARRSVRGKNRLRPDVLLVMDGCCKDPVLDDLWVRRRSDSLYHLFRIEEPCVLIAPDMSVYSKGMPACHKLYQIKRSFVMYARYQAQGLTAVPILTPDTEAHSSAFAEWLEANQCVTHVAASLQTLNARRSPSKRHIDFLLGVASHVSRPLTWLLIGRSERQGDTAERGLGDIRRIAVGPKFGSLRRPRGGIAELPM